MEGNVIVSTLRDEREWANLGEEWNRLLSASAADTVFLTREWLSSWWAAYGAGRELMVLRVDQDGRLIGLAPLYRAEGPRLAGLPYRALALVGDGSGDSDYLDWICAPGSETAVAKAVLDHLRSHCRGWQLLLMNEVPESSPCLAAVERYARAVGWYCRSESVSCARVPLPDTWEGYVSSLRPRMRTKVRSVLRELEKSRGATFDLCERQSDLAERLQSLYGLHGMRWQQKDRPGVFVSEAKRHFYDAMSRRFLERGWLRFYSMRVENRYVAHQFCFEYARKMFLLQEGLDPEWFDHGAGNALRAHVFRDCIARGLEAYDFLGGVTPHKLSWGATVHQSLRVSFGPATLQNHLLFGYHALRALAKRMLRPEAGQSASP